MSVSGRTTLLFGVYGIGNVGDELMLLEMASRLPRPLVVVYVNRRYRNVQVPQDVTEIDIKSRRELHDALRNADIGRIVLGGGAISDMSRGRMRSILDAKEMFPRARVELHGISVDTENPAISDDVLTVAGVASFISCRDAESAEWFRRKGFAAVEECRDLISGRSKRALGVALAEARMQNYSRSAVQEAADACREQGRELVFLPMLADSVCVPDLVRSLDVDGVRWSVFDVPGYPTLVRHVISGLYGLLSFKYHSAMFAMEAGVPTFSVFTKNANKFASIHDGRYGRFDRGLRRLSELKPGEVIDFVRGIGLEPPNA